MGGEREGKGKIERARGVGGTWYMRLHCEDLCSM